MSEDTVTYQQYQNEKDLPSILRLIEKELSEPYSVFTYRYFLNNWPELAFLAMAKGQCVGCIVCKLEKDKRQLSRGYIAMLAVDAPYRGKSIGSALVMKAVALMKEKGCNLVVLETEVTNKGALGLYQKLDFVRDKRLGKYYLNGNDAFRLKLWLTRQTDEAEESAQDTAKEETEAGTVAAAADPAVT